MLIGYSMPAVTGIVLGAGTGAGQAWLTADDGDACFDGKPARKARFLWRNDAVPAIGHYVQVVATLAALTPLRVCAVLGLGASVPIGAAVEIYGKRAGDAGASWNFGGQNTGTVVQFADGTRGCWFILPAGAEAVSQVAFRLVNNVAGATWATAATQVDVGELVAMPAVTLRASDGWQINTIDPSAVSRTRGSQVNVVPQTAYRVLSAALAGMLVPAVRGGGLENGMDLEQLAAALRGSAKCCAIPHYRDVDTKVTDMALANRSAIYGITTTIPDASNVQRGVFRGQIVVEEVPAV